MFVQLSVLIKKIWNIIVNLPNIPQSKECILLSGAEQKDWTFDAEWMAGIVAI